MKLKSVYKINNSRVFPSKISVAVSVFLLLSVLVNVDQLEAQSVNSINIDFSAKNEKLSTILYRLGNETNINFTYNAGDAAFDKKLSYNGINKPPLVILDELLNNTNQTFKQVGNQVVIYKKKDKSDSADTIVVNKNETKSTNDIIPVINSVITDTVFVLDTVIVLQVDTLRVVDTVYVDTDLQKQALFETIDEIVIDSFTQVLAREKGWAASMYIAPIISNFSMVEESGAFSFRNFSFGVEVNRIINDWNISGGIKLTHFSEKFIHTYTVNDGGYFVTDTIDSYYTIINSDTAWYHVTDSTWKPLNSNTHSYDINNKVGYIEFAVSFSYDYYHNNNLRLYAKIGAQSGALIYKNGLAIPTNNKADNIDFADLKFAKLSYSVLMGLGLKYQLNKQLDFNSEVYYLSYLNDMVADYSYDTKIRGLGIRFGLIYYLKWE